MTVRFWEFAPPNTLLRAKIRQKAQRWLPNPFETPPDEEPEPDFVAEEQAGLTALGETQMPTPTGIQTFRAGAGPPGTPSPFRMPTPQEVSTPSPLATGIKESIQGEVGKIREKGFWRALEESVPQNAYEYIRLMAGPEEDPALLQAGRLFGAGIGELGSVKPGAAGKGAGKTPKAKPLPGQAPLAQAGKEAKQPWEMSKQSFIDTEVKNNYEELAKHPRKGEPSALSLGEYKPGSRAESESKMWLGLSHRESVGRALSEGKPVPPEVLADYPELAAKAKPTVSESATAKAIETPAPELVPPSTVAQGETVITPSKAAPQPGAGATIPFASKRPELNGYALYDTETRQLVGPEELERVSDELRMQFGKDVPGEGHDVLAEANALLSGHAGEGEVPRIKYDKQTGMFSIRYDEDGFLRKQGIISQQTYDEDLHDTIVALQKQYPGKGISIPERGDFIAGIGKKSAPQPGAGATPPVKITPEEFYEKRFGEHYSAPETFSPAPQSPSAGLQGEPITETSGLPAKANPKGPLQVLRPAASGEKVTLPPGGMPPVKVTTESVAQVASEKNLDDLYEAASETINRQTKAQGLPEATPPPAVASSRGGRKSPTGKGPASQGGSAPNDSVGKVNEMVYGIPGENNARAAARKWDGARRTMGVEINAQWESGRKMLKGQKTDKDTMLGLYQALHGEGPVPQGQETVYNAIKTIMDKEAADMLAFDPSFSKAMMAHPDYFWRGWREPKASQIGAGRMGATPGFKKPRVDATFTEMVNEGWEPVSWNPFDMAALRRMAGVEYRENAVLVRRLKEAGYALPKDEIPQKGWRVPHVGPAFEGRPFVGQDGKVAFTPPVAVPNPIASQLEGIYGVRPNLGGIGPYIGKFTDALKLGKVAFSLFQHVDYGFRAGFAASSQILRVGKPNIRPVIEYPSLVGRLVNVSLRKSPRDVTRKTILSNTPLYPNGPSLRMIGEEGWMMGSDITFIRRGVMDAVQDAIKDAPTNVLGKAKERIRNIARFTESGLFEGVARESQAWTLEKVIIPNLRKTHPDWTARQIAGSAADEVNVMYSTLGVWQSTFKDPSLRELLRTILFSVNESEAWLKMLVRGFKGDNQRLWGEFGLGTMIFLAGVGNAINYSTTGKPLDANQYSPLSFDSPYAFLPGGIGYNNRFMSPKLPFKGKEGTDLYLDLVGQADTVYRWLLDPPGAVTARYNVLPRAALNQWKGEAFGGRKLETVGERAKQGLSDLFTPIGPGNIMEAARQNIPQVENILPAGETRLGTEGSLAQATGLNVRSLNQREFDEALAKKKGLLAEGESLENKPALRKQVSFLPESQSYAAALGNTQANKVKEIEFTAYKRQQMDDETLEAQQITPDEWRDRLGDRRNQAIGVSKYKQKLEEFADKPPKNDNEKALQGYYKLWQSFDEETYGQYDKKGMLVEKGTGKAPPDINLRLEIYIAKLSPEQREHLQENLHPGATKKVKEYYNDMAALKPFWGMEERMEREYPMMAKLKRKKTLAKANGNELKVREIERFPGYRQYEHELGERRKRIRKSNMQVDYLLKKWGYTSSYLHRENKLRMIGAK